MEKYELTYLLVAGHSRRRGSQGGRIKGRGRDIVVQWAAADGIAVRARDRGDALGLGPGPRGEPAPRRRRASAARAGQSERRQPFVRLPGALVDARLQRLRLGRLERRRRGQPAAPGGGGTAVLEPPGLQVLATTPRRQEHASVR